MGEQDQRPAWRSRRGVLGGIGLGAVVVAAAAWGGRRMLSEQGASGTNDGVVELAWEDLLPSGGDARTRSFQEIGIVGHMDLATGFEQPEASGVTTQYDGRTVRLPGYVVPIDYSGTGVTAFILVPYVGACIHVPPPPANQLVMVTTDRPYEAGSQWDPVAVTGRFGTAGTSTDLAEVGYALSADRIEPYSG